MATSLATHVTPEEYFELERQSDEKHEYFDGAIVLMAGGTPRHSLVTATVTSQLYMRLRGTRCKVYSPDLRVSVRGDQTVAYPDVAVVCGPRELSKRDRHTISNPVVLVEVLSPSSLARDRGTKVSEYLHIPTLRNYLVIDPEVVDVGHWWRLPDGKWELEIVQDRKASIRLESLGIELPVSDIYLDAESDEPELP